MFRPVLDRQTIHTKCHSIVWNTRSYGAKRIRAVEGYKHCIPTEFFVQLK